MPKATTAQAAAIADRQEQVLNLARTGKTFREIGREVGVSHTQARHDFDAAVLALLRPAGEAVKALHIQRAEWMFAQAAEIVLTDSNPDRRLRALDRCAVALAQQARFEGTEAPIKSRIEYVPAETIEAEIARLEAELALNGPPPNRGTA